MIALKSFAEASNLAHEITDKELSNLKSQLGIVIKRNHDFSKILTDATADYLMTGVGQIPENGSRWNGWLNFNKRSYFRWDHYYTKLSKELDRPFVYVNDRHEVTIARREYTKVLVGSFMLTAVERDRNQIRWGSTPREPVMYYKTADKYFFKFIYEMYPLVEHWIGECKTNPEFRRALKLQTTEKNNG